MNPAIPQTDQSPQPNRRPLIFGLTLALVVLLVVSVVAAQNSYKKAFSFVMTDHPIDMWNDGHDRWAYYFTGESDKAKVVAKARAELLPLGFKENDGDKPWVHFAKGNCEVIICNHEEVFLMGSRLEHSPTSGPLKPLPQKEYAVVHVKNGPGTGGPLLHFQILKLLHGW